MTIEKFDPNLEEKVEDKSTEQWVSEIERVDKQITQFARTYPEWIVELILSEDNVRGRYEIEIIIERRENRARTFFPERAFKDPKKAREEIVNLQNHYDRMYGPKQ